MSSAYSFRIKTDATATNSAVQRVTYNVSHFWWWWSWAEFLVGQFCNQLYQLWCSDYPGTCVLPRSPVADYITYLQSYPTNMGTPGNGVTISVCFFFRFYIDKDFMWLSQDIKFAPGTTSLTANSGAYMVAVNCGSGTCTGTRVTTFLSTFLTDHNR
jgi:galacturan 1,4-alpha-galacturonidase